MDNREMQYRKYNQIWLLSLIFGLLLVIVTIVYLDPCFHYHAPVKGVSYQLNDERYQNNGIVRNFEYDAIVTGTSMVENFKTSEVDDIFNVNSVKVPFAGAHFKEINDNLIIALESNPDVALILRCLDIGHIIVDKDAPFQGIADQGYIYPHYLYDTNLINDVSYVLNKRILLKGLDNIRYTVRGGNTSFDNYSYWNDRDEVEFGVSAVIQSYQRGKKVGQIRKLTAEEKKIVIENINQNVMELAKNNPDVEIYLFFSPYSIVWWDIMNNSGAVDYYITAMEIIAEEALKYQNIKLFDFCNDFELVCDLNNYRDSMHYSADINSDMLVWMKEGKYLLTKDNYKNHFDELRDFYVNYDYDTFFANLNVSVGKE